MAVNKTSAQSGYTARTQRKHLTADLVKRLKPQPYPQIIWDVDSRTQSGVAGFGVRCQKRDKVYFLKRRVNGRSRTFTIGKHGDPWTVATARKEAIRLKAAVDPDRERREARNTLAIEGLAKKFMAEYVEPKLKPRTIDNYQRFIDRLIIPKVGRHTVASLSDTDVERFHNALRKTPRQANLCLAILSKMLSWAERGGYRDKGSNPCIGIERFKERKHERYLSTKEFGRLGAALSEAEQPGDAHEDQFIIAAIRQLVFTGARVSEILSLQWTYVDFERGMLRLPDSKTGEKIIYLSAPALQILSELPRVAGNPYVFPGRRKGQPLVNIQRPWRRIRKRANLDDVRLHDLRHSFASVAAANSASLPMIGKLLGHAQAATTQRYAHLSDDPVRRVNDEAGRVIATAMMPNQNKGKVVKMRP